MESYLPALQNESKESHWLDMKLTFFGFKIKLVFHDSLEERVDVGLIFL